MTSTTQSGLVAWAKTLWAAQWLVGLSVPGHTPRVLSSGHISHATVYISKFQNICSGPVTCQTLCILRTEDTKRKARLCSLGWGWAWRQERDAEASLSEDGRSCNRGTFTVLWEQDGIQ